MRLLWTKKALQQLINAQNFIARDNPDAAKQVAERIVQDANLLLHQPEMGRPGRGDQGMGDYANPLPVDL